MKIYLIHAVEAAPERFRQHMLSLRHELEKIHGIEVYIPEPADSRLNVYLCDLIKNKTSILMVGILDYHSDRLGMMIQNRCERQEAMMLFYGIGMKVPRIVTDCIKHHRAQFESPLEFPSDFLDPIEYINIQDIVGRVKDWVRDYPLRFSPQSAPCKVGG